MRELSDEAQSLLNATRGAHDPTDRDRKRLRGAMVAQLGAAAVVSSSATLAAASGGAAAGGMLGAVKVVAAVAVLSLAAGTVTWQATRSARSARSAPVQQAAAPHSALAAVGQAPSTSVPVAQVGAVGEGASAVALVAPIASTSSVATALAAPPRAQAKPLADSVQKTDALAEQVQVLAAARTDLRQGRAEQALAALDNQAELFERGALREEFLAARVLALRALGRVPDAEAAAARFAEEMPRSPLASKVGNLPAEQVEK